MKVSFSLSSKPSNSPLSSSSDQSQQKEFITEFDSSKTLTDSPSIVIPPIPNQWNPQNQSDEYPNIQFDPAPSIEHLMLMNLRNDLQRLPEDPGLGEFDDVPVEEFARAYLKGYGWYEGRGIGKNTKEDVKVVEFANNVGGEGLGFVPMEKMC